FNKTTSGILMPIVFPRYVGVTGIGFGNIGDMANRGVEVEMGYEKKYGPFTLNIRANGSYIKNRVTHLGQGLDFTEDGALQFQGSTYALTRIAVGQPLNSFFGFKTNGIFQDQSEIDNYLGAKGKIQPNAVPGDFRWVDLNNDGQIDANDRTFLGAPTPSWTFGFSLNMSWKTLDFVLFAQGVAGNKVFQGLRRLDISTANWQEAALGRWHGAGTSDTHPRLTTNDVNRNYSHPSDFYLQDAGYLRFKTVQIGYTIPGKFIRTMGLGKARFFLSANNFVTFTKYTGFDPEIGGSSTGVDRGVYPQPKSLLLGLNLTL
ncbi:MAG: SusC/RagA family TonB-linked outer membrane protein, partial [Niabella sp.]